MKRGPDPAKVQQWTRRFERFTRSGQTVAQFCGDEGVSVPSFYQWKKKLTVGSARQSTSSRRRRSGKNQDSRPFKPVQLTVAPSVSAVPGGVMVRMPSGVEIALGNDLQTIRQVVGQLLDRQLGGGGSC